MYKNRHVHIFRAFVIIKIMCNTRENSSRRGLSVLTRIRMIATSLPVFPWILRLLKTSWTVTEWPFLSKLIHSSRRVLYVLKPAWVRLQQPSHSAAGRFCILKGLISLMKHHNVFPVPRPAPYQWEEPASPRTHNLYQLPKVGQRCLSALSGLFL